MEAILAAINQAKVKIWIVTPYFIPTDQIITALQIAVSNRVEVKMILPGKSDSHIVKHASMSYIKPLLQSGIKIYFYNKGFAHAKTMTFDNHLAIIGTANMDTRSFYINFEIAALIYDEKVCGDVDQSFIDDLKECEEIILTRWSNRSFYNRLLDSVYRIHRWADESHIHKRIAIDNVQANLPYTNTESVMKLYKKDFIEMFERNGLQLTKIYGDYQLNEYQEESSPRLILLAQKVV